MSTETMEPPVAPPAPLSREDLQAALAPLVREAVQDAVQAAIPITVSRADLQAALVPLVREAVQEALRGESLRAMLMEIVRTAVREELALLFHKHLPDIRYYLLHEGPHDPEGDELLLQEALVALEHAKAHPETLMSLADFKAELARAEAAGELPR